MNDQRIVAQRLKTAREFLKLSQTKLADLAYCDNRTICSIERAKTNMSIPIAVALAEALHVRPAWLLDLEETVNDSEGIPS